VTVPLGEVNPFPETLTGTVPVGPVWITVIGMAPTVNVPLKVATELEQLGCTGVKLRFGAGVILTVMLRIIGAHDPGGFMIAFNVPEIEVTYVWLVYDGMV